MRRSVIRSKELFQQQIKRFPRALRTNNNESFPGAWVISPDVACNIAAFTHHRWTEWFSAVGRLPRSCSQLPCPAVSLRVELRQRAPPPRCCRGFRAAKLIVAIFRVEECERTSWFLSFMFPLFSLVLSPRRSADPKPVETTPQRIL